MLKIRTGFRLALVALLTSTPVLPGQAAAAITRQAGTVTAVNGSAITITTAAGATVTVSAAAGAKVVQVPPGAKDLSAATPASLSDVAIGDKVLANGTAPDATSFTAARLIVMKSSDINAMHAAEQREWQRGLGGLVKSVDGTTITVVSGAKTLTIRTGPDTLFKQYADDSVDFSNARPGSLAMIHPGDQLRARGTVAEERMSLTAKEVVSGSFENLSGVLSAVDPSAQTITLKDLATKKSITVAVTAKSDLRNLPPDQAARFSARGAGAAAAGAGAANHPSPAAGTSAATPSSKGTTYGERRVGADLSQLLAHLPTVTLAELKPGQTVMIVASQDAASKATAITLLSGVEGILSATPAGQQPITLSPWNIGVEPEAAGGGEGGGGPR